MNGLPKHSRLCGQLRIEQLYKEGHRFVAWPLRVTWQATEDDTQVMVWAPKSLFKHAVDRNHLRRLMREAYRLHQDILNNEPSEAAPQHYLIAFNYMDKEAKDFATIEKAVVKALRKVKGER